MKKIGMKKKNILFGFIIVLLILILVIPVSSILNSKEKEETKDISERNVLSSQVLVTGKDYRLNYEREEQIDEDMEKREKEILKQKKERSPLEKPETAAEIIEELNSDSPPGKNSTDEPEKGSGSEGRENPAVSPGQVPHPEPEENEEEQEPSQTPADHKKPHLEEEGEGHKDQWGFEEEEEKAEAERVKPRITTGGIQDGEHYNGDYKTFFMDVRDYNNEKVYQNGGHMDVYVNGERIPGYDVGWRDPYDIHFTFDLKDGANNISIIVVDREGHRATRSLTVYGDTSEMPPPTGGKTFIFDMSNIGIGTPEHPVIKKTVTVYRDETLEHFIRRAMSEEGYYVEFTDENNYIPRIYKEGMLEGWNIPEGTKAFLEENDSFWGMAMLDEETGEYTFDKSLNSLGEMDFFRGSGWCISTHEEEDNGSLNGNIPYGVRALFADKSGGWITLYWTNCLGYDYNGQWNKGGN